MRWFMERLESSENIPLSILLDIKICSWQCSVNYVLGNQVDYLFLLFHLLFQVSYIKHSEAK